MRIDSKLLYNEIHFLKDFPLLLDTMLLHVLTKLALQAGWSGPSMCSRMACDRDKRASASTDRLSAWYTVATMSRAYAMSR